MMQAKPQIRESRLLLTLALVQMIFTQLSLFTTLAANFFTTR